MIAAIYISQSAEKWGFNHQFLVIKMIAGVKFVSPNLCFSQQLTAITVTSEFSINLLLDIL